VIPGLRRIEAKVINSEADLERERMAYAPVLGKDAWYACAWYAVWRLMTLHMLTPAGAWAIVTTPLAYNVTVRALQGATLPEGGWWTIAGFGIHTGLAWLYLCERHQARNILSAVADWIRGRAGNAKVQPN
jgi:hypothetical protein